MTAFGMDVRELDGLPRLGWLASVDRSTGRVTVWKGSAVESGADWVVEGVWTGDFALADFHTAEHFFGSGIRIHEGEVWIAASSSTVDRILVCEEGNRVHASNSLSLLMGFTGARLVRGHNYRIQSFAQDRDLSAYSRAYPVEHPSIDQFQQVFQERVIVGDGGIRFVNLHRPRDFRSFGEYLEAVKDSLVELDRNIRSEDRRVSVRKFSTISSGYDSTAATALVRDLGIEGAFSLRRSNSDIPLLLSRKAALDDGSRIARCLGVPVIPLRKPERVGTDEFHFLSPSAAPPEFAFYPMYRHFLAESSLGVVFAGHHGGGMWGDRLVDASGQVVVKSDPSGLNLSEARLRGGFLHVPIPALFLWSAPALREISLSAEMAPWRLGGSYDRPIPRRILEEAGVPRNWFGYRKKAVVQAYDEPNNPELRRAFREFLRKELGASWSRWLPVLRAGRRLASIAERVLGRIGVKRRIGGALPDLPFLLFLWALERAAGEARRELEGDGVLVSGSPEGGDARGPTHEVWSA